MAVSWRILRHAGTGDVLLPRVKWCASSWCRFKGLQFVRHLPDEEGVLFVTASESRTNTAIHMFFCFFPIAVIWLDKSGLVVDKALAKPWRPAYVPKAPAQYFLEAKPHVLDKVAVGDMLTFDEVTV